VVIGINWKAIWKAVWKPVWAQSVTTGSHASSGALQAGSAAVAGTAAHKTLHTSSGALNAGAATVAGTAAHFTLHDATGALVAGAARVSGEARDETTYVATTAEVAAGKPKKRRRRYQLEIDGEVIEVSSINEAQAILDEVRAKAEETARLAVSRAVKAKRKPAREVIKDARKTLQLPDIKAQGDLNEYASKMIDQIKAQYESALRSIEIGALLARQDYIIEQDDEEVLMLL
jgi:hypothetical protein